MYKIVERRSTREKTSTKITSTTHAGRHLLRAPLQVFAARDCEGRGAAGELERRLAEIVHRSAGGGQPQEGGGGIAQPGGRLALCFGCTENRECEAVK